MTLCFFASAVATKSAAIAASHRLSFLVTHRGRLRTLLFVGAEAQDGTVRVPLTLRALSPRHSHTHSARLPLPKRLLFFSARAFSHFWLVSTLCVVTSTYFSGVSCLKLKFTSTLGKLNAANSLSFFSLSTLFAL